MNIGSEMKKILITGSKGFLGQHLVKKLKGKYSLLTPSASELNVEKINELHNYIPFQEPDAVIHLAAVCGGIGANQKSPADFFMRNSLMSLNILSACNFFKVNKLITLGSVCSYPKFTPVPFKEEDMWEGYPEETNAPYGIAKKSLMQLLIAYKEQYNFNAINLIPVNMYGPEDNFNPESSHVIPALIRKFHRATLEKPHQKVSVWGTGNASREFLYIDDCARAIIMAMEEHNDPEPVNIGTGIEITIKDLVNTISKKMSYEGKIVWRSEKPDGQPRRCLDTSKAEKLFGFKAETDFDKGLQKTIDWFEGAIRI